jgi:two-component sensor histidine kinase
MNFVLQKLLLSVFTLSLPISFEWNKIISLFYSYSGMNLGGRIDDLFVWFLEFNNILHFSSNSFYLIMILWWENWRFITLLILFFLGIVLLVLSVYLFFLKKREETRTREGNWKSDLQIKSLQYQLDPHFIFNSLNSIQSYILDEQKENALDCLSDFSNVLRKKIEHADRDFVSLWEEIEYLQLYLKLEQMRFSNKFSFHLHVNPFINSRQFKIPPMFIQPFLENAIKYGLSGFDGDGVLNVNFELQENDYLCCTISDNGLGRKKSKILQETSNLKNHHKTVKITKDRMDLLNKMQAEGRFYSYCTEDLEDENGLAKGTRVKITFPKQDDSYCK